MTPDIEKLLRDIEIGQLRLEVADLQRQNAALRQMIPLLKSRMASFIQWFERTIDGIH